MKGIPADRALLLSLLLAPLGAQVAWDLDQVPLRSGPMVWDSARQRLVLCAVDFLNFGTWERSGSRWRRVADPFRITLRDGHAMAYDSVRQRTVLFGGSNTDDTSEWNGTTWTQRFVATRPPARSNHSMAFDSLRARVVMFGGAAPSGGSFNDTWEWDGTSWTQLFPTTAPLGRNSQAMCFDSSHNVTILFGGYTLAGNPANDTWEWNGTTWTQRTVATPPPRRLAAGLTFDPVRARAVLFGGQVGSPLTPANDTWEWDGTNWTQVLTVTQPSARVMHGMAFDGSIGRVVLFGGYDIFGPQLRDAWQFDGANWTPVFDPWPGERQAHAMTYVAQQQATVLFGGQGPNATAPGLGDTWLQRGGVWQQSTTTAAPSGRRGHAMAPAGNRGVAVLFGGSEFYRARPGDPWLQRNVDDTWEWDGANWHAVSAATRPSPRQGHVMAFDPVTQRVLLFGGTDAVDLDDTWLFDGAQWTQSPASPHPAARQQAAMVTDTNRQRIVLFGGVTAGLVLSYADTWEWDGAAWSQRTGAPQSRFRHAMAYDSIRRRTVLGGGYFTLASRLGDTWEYDGTSWQARGPVGGQPTFAYSSMTFDVDQRRCVFFDGNQHGFYGPVALADYVTTSSGCPGSAGTPDLHIVDDELPWIGQLLRVEVTNLPANAPVAVLTGFSDTVWDQVPLPLDLTQLGLPGCVLSTSGDRIDPAITNGTTASLLLFVPLSTSLYGVRFWQQAVVADAAANPAGFVLSNSRAGRIGSR